MMKVNYKALPNLLCIFSIQAILTGCVTLETKVSKNYQFTPSAAEGLVAFTVTCNVTKGQVSSHIYQGSVQDFAKRNLIFAKSNYTEFACNSPGDGMSKPELKIINLPAGNYFIEWPFLSTNYNSVYFTVQPGKVTYFGELNLKSDIDFASTTSVKNVASRDIPWIKKELPLIKNRDIQVLPAIAPPSKY